jgi:hypothetical protein
VEPYPSNQPTPSEVTQPIPGEVIQPTPNEITQPTPNESTYITNIYNIDLGETNWLLNAMFRNQLDAMFNDAYAMGELAYILNAQFYILTENQELHGSYMRDVVYVLFLL